jgi:hypothetical protein
MINNLLTAEFYRASQFGECRAIMTVAAMAKHNELADFCQKQALTWAVGR